MSIEEQQIERPFGSVASESQAIELWLLDKALSSFSIWDWEKACDVQDRVQRGSELLLADASLAFLFARDYVKGRFSEAEEAIARNPYWAIRYARDVIQGRFPEAEEMIAGRSRLAVKYASDVIQGRFTQAEDEIAASAEEAETYCDLFVHLFDERAAGLHPHFAYRYAKDVVKGSLPPQLHQKMQLWGMSNEHKGNRYLERYLTSKRYQ